MANAWLLSCWVHFTVYTQAQALCPLLQALENLVLLLFASHAFLGLHGLVFSVSASFWPYWYAILPNNFLSSALLGTLTALCPVQSSHAPVTVLLWEAMIYSEKQPNHTLIWSLRLTQWPMSLGLRRSVFHIDFQLSRWKLGQVHLALPPWV